jgi:hypothetical protein
MAFALDPLEHKQYIASFMISSSDNFPYFVSRNRRDSLFAIRFYLAVMTRQARSATFSAQAMKAAASSWRS